MADPYLKAIVTEAENGTALPWLRLVAGKTTFFGRPGPSSAFHDAATKGLAEVYYNQEKVKKRDVAERYQQALTQGEEWARPVIAAVSGLDTGEVLTLLDCQLHSSLGSIQVRVIRIPFEAIEGWRVSGGERELSSASGDGVGFFVGGVFPVEN